MRYLIYLPIPKSITDLLDGEPDERIHPPRSGYHLTVWQINTDEEREKELANILKHIRIPRVTLEITGLKQFGRDGKCSQVLTVTLPFDLRRLHMLILEKL
jgi:2'-5' RNA ligase